MVKFEAPIPSTTTTTSTSWHLPTPPAFISPEYCFVTDNDYHCYVISIDKRENWMRWKAENLELIMSNDWPEEVPDYATRLTYDLGCYGFKCLRLLK